jgi:hypothetical protein
MALVGSMATPKCSSDLVRDPDYASKRVGDVLVHRYVCRFCRDAGADAAASCSASAWFSDAVAPRS